MTISSQSDIYISIDEYQFPFCFEFKSIEYFLNQYRVFIKLCFIYLHKWKINHTKLCALQFFVWEDLPIAGGLTWNTTLVI